MSTTRATYCVMTHAKLSHSCPFVCTSQLASHLPGSSISAFLYRLRVGAVRHYVEGLDCLIEAGLPSTMRAQPVLCSVMPLQSGLITGTPKMCPGSSSLLFALEVSMQTCLVCRSAFDVVLALCNACADAHGFIFSCRTWRITASRTPTQHSNTWPTRRRT